MRLIQLILIALLSIGCNKEVTKKNCKEAAHMWAMAHNIKKATVSCTWDGPGSSTCDVVANGNRAYKLRCYEGGQCYLLDYD
jgi:hypothetical protein